MRVWLRDMERFVALNGLKEVTNSVSFERGMIPTSDGLFSTEIFGMSVTDRKSTYAYIDLKKHFLTLEHCGEDAVNDILTDESVLAHPRIEIW